MNQSFSISLGQFLSFIALGIGVAFGLYFCIEAIVAECRRWGKWREARRLVREAEDTEAMKGYRMRLREMQPTEAMKAWREINDLMGGKK